MKISSLIPAQPGLKVCVSTDYEKGDADTRERLEEYDVIAWAVVGKDDGDEVEPVFIDDNGRSVTFSQHELDHCADPGFSEMGYEIDDSQID